VSLVSLLLPALGFSLVIVAIYSLLKQGMLLGWVRILGANFIDWLFLWMHENNRPGSSRSTAAAQRWSMYVQKPLWSCLTCMASVWTILLSWSFNVKLILLVCGINAIIDKLIGDED
jgi:hypothetical protein